ncbi:M23 family metallopeptidase [Marinicauda sp. Alg238-R41]|uniref:M23 family metallopeptidase n=1 Tax=Marinicauda sp. Alg238-R41 TaxID=2993447 RepID=UPI0022E17723|nr:M23 family metallopeptidase [Marinicauda sp. Alg238-R41]
MGQRACALRVTTALAAALTVLAGCSSSPRGPADVVYRIGDGQASAGASRPCGSSYTVRAGDTLSAIAQRCGVSFGELASENGLAAPYTISPGQALRVPGPSTYVVQRGQNLYRIALAHGMSVEALAALNGLNAPYTIYPGQELRVRGEARQPVSTPSVARPDREVRVEEAPPRRPASPPPPPPPPAADAPDFSWPLRGEVLSRFGPQEGGGRKDGWTIAARVGAPVQAAAAGEVVYAGNELQGYGNLVLIRHGGNWVTAYAHNSRLLVSVGEQVRSGAQIAEAGATGNAERVQLYFEIRRGVTPVDPADYLR